MRKRNFTSLLFFCLLLSVSVLSIKAQTVTSSPYSRFGIGEYSNKILAQSAGLGGTHIALQNDTLLPLFLNPANPASYTTNKITAFEVGVNSIFNKFSTSSSTSQSNNTTFNYIALGFPVGKRMGGCLGVMPSSNVGYTIKKFSSVENIGTIEELYTGDGGVNQLFVGLAISPFAKAIKKYKGPKKDQDTSIHINYRKDLFIKRFLSSISIGGNANYHFGTINNVSRVLYPSQVVYFNTAQTTQTVVRGLSGNFGLMGTITKDSIRDYYRDTAKSSATFGQKIYYTRDLKEDVYFTLGYTFSLNNQLKTKYSDFAYTFLYQSNGINEYIRDTINLQNDVNAPITLPAMHGVGFSIKKGNKLNILGDFEAQLWSGFHYINETNKLKDMKRLSLGVEYIPNKLANTKGEKWKKIQFRAGVHYSDGNLLINNSRVNEYGVTLGLGLPIGNGRFFNVFNISSEFGQIGTTTNNLVQQQYIRVKLGFTFNDRWFIKYKYD